MTGQKTIEIQSWPTKIRGDALLCASAKPNNIKVDETGMLLPSGQALCIAEIVDCVPFEQKHLKQACCNKEDWQPGYYAWVLRNIRPIEPFPVKEKLGFYEVECQPRILRKKEK